MDPNATLARIRERAQEILSIRAAGDEALAAADELAEHVQAMDEWLSKGGFLPQAWAENCDFDRQMRDQYIRRRHIVQGDQP